MSAYLDFKLKKKGCKESLYPSVLSLCTSPARELANNFSFVYGENLNQKNKEYNGWTVLSNKTIDDIVLYYKNKIREYKNINIGARADINEKKKMLPLVNSLEVYNNIEEEISELEDNIFDMKNEIEDISYLYCNFKNLQSILVSEEDVEIIYYYE